MKDNVFIKYLEETMGISSSRFIPKPVSADEVGKLFWDLFKGDYKNISGLPYQVEYEADADQAVLDYVYLGKSWDSQSAAILRIIMERQIQMISSAYGLQAEGRPIISLPKNFPDAKRKPALFLALLYQTELPLPVSDRSDFELPPLAQVAPLTRQ